MIMMDWPLAITALLFFVISWPYAWGLLRFFGNNFHWDKAAVLGILFVTSGTYTFVWTIRRVLGYELSPVVFEQCVYDLFIVFSAALPGMMFVRYQLVKRRRAQYQELIRLQKENADLKLKLQEAKKNCPDNLTIIEDEYTDFSFWVLETSRN